MKLIVVNKNEAGQRLDKLLAKYLNKAPQSFLYKMLRKKNITLNGKKAAGSEKTALGDEIKVFFSEETWNKFSVGQVSLPKAAGKLNVIFEDDHILLINKPAGMLSQRANPDDVSLVDEVTAYLLSSGQLTEASLKGFKPGICNRLDRNTSGIVVAGKSLPGLQQMNECFKNRSIHKYYLCIVVGEIKDEQRIEGYLTKSKADNQVYITTLPEGDDAQPICTHYRPVSTGRLWAGSQCTLLEVELITGRSHQIRAHLAAAGHPIIGDGKYGDSAVNQRVQQRLRLKHQLLHSYRLVLPRLEGTLAGLSQRTFTAPLPGQFERIRKECGLSYGNVEFQGIKRIHS